MKMLRAVSRDQIAFLPADAKQVFTNYARQPISHLKLMIIILLSVSSLAEVFRAEVCPNHTAADIQTLCQSEQVIRAVGDFSAETFETTMYIEQNIYQPLFLPRLREYIP